MTPYQELLERADAQIKQLRQRADELYDDGEWQDGDLMWLSANVIEDFTLPSRLEHTPDV